MLSRKQITFDIDTKIAEAIFGQSYRMLYFYIENMLKDNGFRHIQGSVYQSIGTVSNISVIVLMSELIQNKPGIEKCIRDIRVTDISKINDLNYLFEYDGTTGLYADRSKVTTRSDEEMER
ncbi:MAG: hypothetical protein NC393_12915 [Clostridium sp.]|nr:hypothetical protein [Clostridium sp.]MCM1173012.1 hypothetical protein [Clostridium sp.]MCM1208744.1 hypothetical protein [Ruminococcus sp.]